MTLMPGATVDEPVIEPPEIAMALVLAGIADKTRLGSAAAKPGLGICATENATGRAVVGAPPPPGWITWTHESYRAR